MCHSEKLEPQKVCFGSFDGRTPTLAAVTTGGRILLYNPHTGSPDEASTSFLHIKKDIQAVTAGCLDPESGRDVLLIGTGRDLQAYDVKENCDMFCRDIPDGVGSLLVGVLGGHTKPLVFVGGNLSITGLNSLGKEQFWTVSNEFVSAMSFCDVDNDGQLELLAGAHSFDIHIFKQEVVIAEVKEADQVTALCPIWEGSFGYALQNGTVGVYANMTRAWRIKSKNGVNCICSYDLDGDGVPELMSGWGNGKLEVRNHQTGEVTFRDQLRQPVVDISTADLRNDGTRQVIVSSSDGEIRGYLPADSTSSVAKGNHDSHLLELALADLHQKRKELSQELGFLQGNIAHYEGKDVDGLDRQGSVQDVIPADTSVLCSLEPNMQSKKLQLVLKTNNSTVIKGVVIFAEQVFDGESLFVCPKDALNTLIVPITPSKDVQVEMLLKVFVGSATSKVYHVFDLDAKLPRFGMYCPQPADMLPKPRGCVTFSLPERISRFVIWMQKVFQSCPGPSPTGAISAGFLSLRDGSPLIIVLEPTASQTDVTIMANTMAIAGDIFQEMIQEVGDFNVSSVVDFPEDLAAFRDVVDAVSESNISRMRMVAEIADATNLLKNLVVKAEDARILCSMSAMRKNYRLLRNLNGELANEHEKRALKHNELQNNLKAVNNMIQAAAKLRNRQPKTDLVAACRKAFQSKNTDLLLKLIQEGC